MKKAFIILFYSLFVLRICIAQKNNVQFEHISIDQGLSQSEVNCICQDKVGFIWIGTVDGLNKFDGYDINVYRENSDVPNSISNNNIQSIFEDNSGNLWIGTFNGGLNRYDRKLDRFYAFKPEKNNSKSIASDRINFITQSTSGDILLGTQKGLSIIRSKNINNMVPEFSNYLNLEINAILEDNNRHFWLATWNGLYEITFDKTGSPVVLAHYNHDMNAPSSLISDGVLSLFQDEDSTLWIGTNNGLEMLTLKQQVGGNKGKFTHYQSGGKDDSNSLPNNQVLAIYRDRTGKLLIGTRGGGFSNLDKKSKTFITVKAEKSIPTSLSNNSVKCFFEDRTGVLWIGTLGGGVDKIDLLRKKFNNYEIALKNINQVPSNFIRAIFEDKKGLMWIGTLDGGLFTYDRSSNTFTKFNEIDNGIESDKAPRNSNRAIYGRNVFSIIEGDDEHLFIGTNGGINILNRKTGRLTYHAMDYNNPDSLMSNSVFSIAKDDDGTYWVGTWGALHHYIPPQKGRAGYFIRYRNNPMDVNSISGDIIRYIYNDPLNSDLWISTMDGGLNRLIKNNRNNSIRFIQYKHDKNDLGSISSNEVNMVLRSRLGDIWIATNDGLNKLVPSDKTYKCSFVKYKEKDGLPGNHIQSILEDNKGNLWLGTNKGLSKFNPVTNEFSNFDISDGLQSNEFSEHACFLNKAGEMFFGGVNGFNSFYPDSIKNNNFKPTTVISNLLVFNQKVPIGKSKEGRIILNNSITFSNEIELSYKENVFTIEFSSLHFASPEKDRYAYKMEGVNDDWLFTDAKNRKATFTNLKGGTYIFKVKASNNDGIWQESPTVLKIRIIPPIWKTWQAYIVYLFVMIFVVYSIFNEIKAKERLKAEVVLKNIDKEKAEELNQMKLQFFTNISHEFRTPLTLIISPIESIIGTIKGHGIFKDQLLIIHRNAKYLLKLVNELMDFRKAETGSLQLSASKNNLVAFVSDIVSTFDNIAEKRHIKYNFSPEIDEIDVWFDKEMLIKILNNLIYNAFKFTSDEGQIDITIEKGKGHEDKLLINKYEISEGEDIGSDCVSIKIKDNGIGISKQSITDIFNRYYQVGSSDSITHLGSGIGLALTKNLVLLNKGEIKVCSERNIGTEFFVRLRLGDSHLNESEKLSETDSLDEQQFNNEDTIFLEGSPQSFENEGALSDIDDIESIPLILIVEDNDDMRQFIKNNLQRKFKVIEAVNGKEGFDLAIAKMPDLIVSDVIMPGMNGIQLCQKLKKDVITSHIPVVLLTALASVSDQIEGLETGADDYISKPFNYKIFEVRVENLIRSRKKLRQRFGKEITVESKDFTLNRRDQEFLDRAVKLVKEKITEPELSVDNLSKELGFSRMHLHRKITALTDQTPSEFIRTIRLREAARLLTENRLSISEIAYQVGFTAPSYFTTCFRKQFGISPKEYLLGYTNKNNI